MPHKKKRAGHREAPWAVAIQIWIASLALAMTISSTALALPRPVDHVTDQADILSAASETTLNALLRDFEQQTKIEIAVATIADLAEEPIEDYAVRLFKEWGIGKAKEDNGVLVVVAPRERALRIEVGYGLEGGLNDAAAGRIIRDTIIPYFKQGDYEGGIAAGVQTILTTLNDRLELHFQPSRDTLLNEVPAPHRRSIGSLVIKGIVFLILLILFIQNPFLFLILMGGRGGRSRGFGGGGFGGGGFGGFGGGMSGGGGASGRW